MEDFCQFSKGMRHIDIWTVLPTVDGGQDQVNYKDASTPDGDQTIKRNPTSDLGINCEFEI